MLTLTLKTIPSLMTCIIQLKTIKKFLQFSKKYFRINRNIVEQPKTCNGTKNWNRISSDAYYLIYVLDDAFGVLIKFFRRHAIHCAFYRIQRDALPSVREWSVVTFISKARYKAWVTTRCTLTVSFLTPSLPGTYDIT